MAGIKINGDTSGSTTITAPNTGTDETIELSTALASKLPYSFGTATPSTTDSGFLWYDSNSTPAQPKHWNGSSFVPVSGMTLITTASFSAFTGVVIDGCFTSAYTNYLVKVNITANSTTNTTAFRLRASGSDNSSSVYSNATYAFRSGNAAAVNTANEAATALAMIATSSNQRHLDISIFRPQVNSPTSFSWTGIIYSPSTSTGFDSNALWGGGTHNASYQADGFTLFTGSGTITGSLSVYGYKD